MGVSTGLYLELRVLVSLANIETNMREKRSVCARLVRARWHF